jgi:hypothetical protein
MNNTIEWNKNNAFEGKPTNVDNTDRNCVDKDVCDVYDKLLTISPGTLEASTEITIASFVPLLTIVKFDSLTSSFQNYVNTFGVPLLRQLYSLLNRKLKSDSISFSMYDLYYLTLIAKGLNKDTTKPFSPLADRFWKNGGFQNATREGEPAYLGMVGSRGGKGKTKKTTKKASAKKSSTKK